MGTPNSVPSAPGRRRLSGRPIAAAGMLLILAGIVLAVIYSLWRQEVVGLLADRLSPDHTITSEGQRQLTNALSLFVIMVIGAGAGLLVVSKESWRRRALSVFLSEVVPGSARNRPSPMFVLLASSVVGVFLVVHMKLYDPGSETFRVLYKEDGVFETMTPVVMLLSAVILGRAAGLSARESKRSWYIAAACASVAAAFVVYAGEEVSWGQRLFHWQTPEIFSGNEQNETNVHNFYNSHFASLYRIPMILPFLVLVSSWLRMRSKWRPASRAVLPHPSLIGLACVVAAVSLVWFTEEEMIEELMAAFCFFYSARAYGCLKAALARDVSDFSNGITSEPLVLSSAGCRESKQHLS